MRRGGIPYDQLQKTNMYGSNDNNAADLEDRYAEHNADGAAAAGGKKKKKGRKRPKVNIEGTGSMNPDVMEESMHSNLDDGRSGHSENRRFFEDQMARVTGSIKASNDASMELQNPKAYQEKGDSQRHQDWHPVQLRQEARRAGESDKNVANKEHDESQIQHFLAYIYVKLILKSGLQID